jgi:hypothetical protein
VSRAPAPTNGLRYFDASHRYKLDGEWVPGVTTILGVLAKPALTKWAASQVAEYVADNPEAVDHLREMGRAPMVGALKEVPWQKRDDAALRGTTFHDFAERIARGEEVDVPEAQVPLVEAALRFMEDYDITPTLVEVVVGSREHQYAGKVDLFANDAIWDWKSGKRIYASTAFQLAAYAGAEFYGENCDEHPPPTVKAAYGVHIDPTAYTPGYAVFPLEFGPNVFAEFVTIRHAFDINKRAEGNWKLAGSGYVGIALTSPSQEQTA